ADGETVHQVEVAEISAPGEAVFVLRLGGEIVARVSTAWTPPRRWVVHVVQLSHHDVGYTDLASHVLVEHDRWFEATVEMVAATREYPEDARFRAVVEQAWSIDHYLRHTLPGRAAAVLELLRRGDLELTALFGNLTTELCGHETLARGVYHAFRLQREHGIPILSAEHNDIPGISWGLSQVLTEAGIRIFCPGLPKYYSWGHPGAPSFWDEAALFGAEGRPGAFWWEAPSSRRVLFWCNNQGCGGGCDPRMPGLAERLQELQEGGYPYAVLRWPVGGGARDNSPYIEGYAHTIRAWNERWLSPHLVCSTNARFYADLVRQLPADLPVFRGDLPGQDYPVGAASTAAATAVNRRNHVDLPAAEALATVAAGLTDHEYPVERLFAAYEEVLWHDEHTWGHHFPAGPTAGAAELEKAVHAHRAAALAHDVASKAMARIADAVRLDDPGLHLVVFNPLPHGRSGLVRTPLRELDNCGSTMMRTEQGTLRGVLLHDRWHVHPPAEVVAGHFDLIDVADGREIAFQIDEIRSPFSPQPYAAQRLGLGGGGKRYGFFEDPVGLKYDLLFRAEAVPPLGYRTYRLRPRVERPIARPRATAADNVLENAFYRLELDPETGFVRSLVDRETGRELIEPEAAHPFGAVLVRDPYGQTESATLQGLVSGVHGAITETVQAAFIAAGHPRLEVTYTLYADEKRFEVAVALLKDPTPLLEAYLAFPFNLPEGRFRYEAPLSVVDPGRDLLPGAYADRLAVQNWVAVSDGELSILWTSHDAPVVSLARLWPGRVSPAHSAVVRDDLVHPPQGAEELRGGAIYSLLTANNFGTNLSVSQSGALLFRYSLTTVVGDLSNGEAVRRGAGFLTSLSAIFTEHPRPRPLSPVGSFLSVDPPTVRLVALKRAEDGNGLIVRLWNPDTEEIQARLAVPSRRMTAAVLTDLAEGADGANLEIGPGRVTVPLGPGSVATVRLILSPR
ncbi:MAG: glycoside hydrolase family 38 C-terminal domain-containing protein, partial [Candidatus Latescibacterota bacterium]